MKHSVLNRLLHFTNSRHNHSFHNLRGICIQTRSLNSRTNNNQPRMTSRLPSSLPHIRRARLRQSLIQERKESNPHQLVSSQPHNLYDFLNEVLVKLLHNLVKIKSWTNHPYTSMAYPFQIGFQDASSPIIEELIHFHDHTLIIVFLISTLVLYIIALILSTKLTHTSTIDAQEVETI